MSDESLVTNQTSATDAQQNQETQKTYTQEEFDRHMAGLRHSLEKRFERQLSELGDLEELKQLKQTAEKSRQDEALKRGDFEKILQDVIAKKDSEIQKRDQTIKEYKVNAPLIEAASKNRAIAPEQVRQLLSSKVRLNEVGDVEVVDDSGVVRYSDRGSPLSVDELVKEFLTQNPHFVASGPATTNTKSNDGVRVAGEFDVSKLDFKNAKHREMYKEAKSKGLI